MRKRKESNRNCSISSAFSEIEETEAEMGFKGRSEESSIFILDMLNLKCLYDVLAEMSCRQLDV